MTDDDTRGMVTRPLLVTAAAMFVVMVALSVWAYTRLPADALVPLHWDASGAVDDYASKGVGLFALVAAFPLLVGALLLVPRIEPRRRNLMRSASAYRTTMYAVMGFFVALHAMIVASALGSGIDIDRLVVLAVGVLLLVIGTGCRRSAATSCLACAHRGHCRAITPGAARIARPGGPSWGWGWRQSCSGH
jgi:uncharacterized membrane protein